MNKLVYLYELDSVRNSRQEIIIGQQAMFEEIVLNGNVVVVSFQQLVDSQAFLCAINDDKCYEQIMKLFFNGSIRISQYSEAKTASEYLQNSIERCIPKSVSAEYIFSRIPILYKETDLLQKLYRVLKYSDFGALDEFLSENPDEKNRIEYLKKYVRLILTVSSIEGVYIAEKNNRYYKFIDYIHIIIERSGDEFFNKNADMVGLFEESLNLLCDIKSKISGKDINKRTKWIEKLSDLEKSCEASMAEAIINLCYNYAVENSIQGVSTHYDTSNKEQFLKDFGKRISQYWEETKEKIHMHQKEITNEVSEINIPLPPWKTAVRITDIRKKSDWKFHENDTYSLYEDNYQEEKKRWKKQRRKILIKNVMNALFYLMIFTFLNIFITIIQGIFEKRGQLFISTENDCCVNIVKFIVIPFISTILFGIATSVIVSRFKLPDVLESLKDLFKAGRDWWIVRKAPINKAYKSLEGRKNVE